MHTAMAITASRGLGKRLRRSRRAPQLEWGAADRDREG
jgi:hypothetical protein